MKKISFYPSIFQAEETNAMGRQLVISVETSKSDDAVLLQAKTAIQTSNANLTQVLNAVLSNPYTQQLADEDGGRDDTYVGGRNVIEGFTHWVFDIPKKEAADRLIEVFNRNGWSQQNYGYQKQSSATMSLIADLEKTDMQKDLTTLNLMGWFKALVKAEKKFEKTFNLKAAHKNSKESAEKREAQIPVNQDIEKLIIYINSIILFNPDDEAWNKIFNDVEGIVKQATTTARTRRSSYNNKTEEEK